jgi:hypothetical protein
VPDTRAYNYNFDTNGFKTTSPDAATYNCNVNATSNLTIAWQSPAFVSLGNYGSMDDNFCVNHALPSITYGQTNATIPSFYVVDLSSGRTLYMQTNF